MNIKIILPYNIIIFGAKGDLACRKLIPALYNLDIYNLLHKNTKIIGVGRANWSNEEYIFQVLKALKKFNNKVINYKIWKKFKSRLLFCNIDVCNTKNFIHLKKILCKHLNTNIYYFAMPPNTFHNICHGLGTAKINHHPNRIIVEKPIGTSFTSSKIINDQIGKYFHEKQIFRIDHYLGKETILNLLILRFANPLFYHVWNNQYIEHIQIIVSEDIGIEGRWKYFNQVGQIKDMLQNHLLQILTLITMDAPKTLNSKNIQQEKIKIIKLICPINSKTIHENIVTGQYSSGCINGKNIPSYLNEGNEKNSNTETFIAIKININHKKWKNIPFYLKTGKRLHKKKTEIIIYFKPTSIKIFDTKNYKPNKLKIKIQPNESITIQFINKTPDLHSKYHIDNQNLNFNYKNSFKNFNIPDAYELLLLESMKNDQSLFVSREEIEESWKWIDSIIENLKNNNIKPKLYKPGTWGPKISDALIQKNGYNWDHE